MNEAGLIKIMKVLANKSRLKILRMIMANPESLCLYDMVNAMNMPMATIHFHLKKLEAAKIISAKHKGVKVMFSANHILIDTFQKDISSFL